MKMLIFILLIFASLNTFGQNDTIKFGEHDLVFASLDSSNGFLRADKFPTFKGGFENLIKFVLRNITYPESAINDSIQGRVIVTFYVTRKGEIKNQRILKGIRSDTDNECYKMPMKMPSWNPAEKDNKPIDYSVTFPIIFKL